ncbi:hypothetical protein SFUMM280S_07287 [Streptomyces fumanus]
MKYQETPESASACGAPSNGLRLTPLRPAAGAVGSGLGAVVGAGPGAAPDPWKAMVRPVHLVHWYMVRLPGSASCFDQAYAVGHFWLTASL